MKAAFAITPGTGMVIVGIVLFTGAVVLTLIGVATADKRHRTMQKKILECYDLRIGRK